MLYEMCRQRYEVETGVGSLCSTRPILCVTFICKAIFLTHVYFCPQISDLDSIVSTDSLKRSSLRIDEEEGEKNINQDEKENVPCENGDMVSPLPRTDEINGNGHVPSGKRGSLEREISVTSVTSTEENGENLENSRRGSKFRSFGSLRRSKTKGSEKKKRKVSTINQNICL